MEDVFERFFGQPTRPIQNATTLPVDVTESHGNLVVKAAVPGVDPKNLEVTIENQILTIRGEIKNENSSEGEKVYRREVSYGAFSRSIRLPEKLDLDAIKAEFVHGMVTITLPRLPEVKPEIRRVEVKTASSAATATSHDPVSPSHSE
jgi:HSP20 family protein